VNCRSVLEEASFFVFSATEQMQLAFNQRHETREQE
jgi:hypothetical protein